MEFFKRSITTQSKVHVIKGSALFTLQQSYGPQCFDTHFSSVLPIWYFYIFRETDGHLSLILKNEHKLARTIISKYEGRRGQK